MTSPEWPWGNLERGAYSLIMADPPWHFATRSPKGEGRSPQAHYQTMSLEDIAALPVKALAAENCLLWLWATAPLLDRQIDILKAWGFGYASTMVWCKTTRKTGRISMGTGYYARNSHEHVLLGKVGSPKMSSRSVRSVVMGPVREHSRKPDSAYDAARALVSYGRAADLFAREVRPGWESWGDELGKFQGAFL